MESLLVRLKIGSWFCGFVGTNDDGSDDDDVNDDDGDDEDVWYWLPSQKNKLSLNQEKPRFPVF